MTVVAAVAASAVSVILSALTTVAEDVIVWSNFSCERSRCSRVAKDIINFRLFVFATG